MSDKKGFSVVDIFIAMAVVLIMLSVATPLLRNAHANAGSAVHANAR